MDLTILRRAGLSDGEIKLYKALLDLGNSPINKIHERTGMERRNIYDILNKLIEKGLVIYIDENKRRTFNLSHPKKIISYLEEKKDEINNTENSISKVLPSMVEKFNSSKTEINAEIFRGGEGIKAVWEDMLNYKELRWLGSGNYVPCKFPVFFANWNKRRNKKKIESFHLFRNEMRGKMIKDIGHVKFLPREFSGNPTFTTIYGNKVAQFLIGESLFAFVIESKELSENYRRYHKYLWKKSKK